MWALFSNLVFVVQVGRPGGRLHYVGQEYSSLHFGVLPAPGSGSHPPGSLGTVLGKHLCASWGPLPLHHGSQREMFFGKSDLMILEVRHGKWLIQSFNMNVHSVGTWGHILGVNLAIGL